MGLMETAQLLGNFGEFVGAFAVVATLVYLAIQVRHGSASLDANTRSLKAQVSQARADNQSAKFRALMDSPHYAAMLAKRKAAESTEAWVAALSPEEWMRMRMYHLLEFNDVSNQFYQYREGFLDEGIWASSTRGQIERLLQHLTHFLPVMNRLDPTFKAMLDDVAQESGFPRIDDSGIGDQFTSLPESDE